MSQSDQPRGASAGAPESHLLNVQPTEMTGWVGWIAFAGVMMVLLGTFHAIQGLVALFQDEYFLVAKSGLTVHVDYTAWGWVHLDPRDHHRRVPDSPSSPARPGLVPSAS